MSSDDELSAFRRPGRRDALGNPLCGIFPSSSSSSKPKLHLSAFVLCAAAIVSLLPPGVAGQDNEMPTPTVDPHRLTVEIGTEESVVTCSFQEFEDDKTVYEYKWFDVESQEIAEIDVDNSSRIFYNATSGELTIREAELNDTGDYTCVVIDYPSNCTVDDDTSGCTNATLAFKVYEMPDYTTDGIIIGSINGALLLIFVACLIHSAVVDRRRLKKYGHKF